MEVLRLPVPLLPGPTAHDCWGLRKSSSHVAFFAFLQRSLLTGRHASPVTPCKTGRAHCFLQNHFPLKKMLPHKQRVQWPLRQFSFGASELGLQRAGSPVRCHRDGSHLCRLAAQGPERMAVGEARPGPICSRGNSHSGKKILSSAQHSRGKQDILSRLLYKTSILQENQFDLDVFILKRINT